MSPELSKNIIQKGLAFARDWSGTVAHSGSEDAQEILPRWLRGRRGASVVRRDAARTRMEDPDDKVQRQAFPRSYGGKSDYCPADKPNQGIVLGRSNRQRRT